MSGGGGVEAVINRARRVPSYIVWAVLSAAWVVTLRIIEPDAKAPDYFHIPIYIGVAFIVARMTPRRHGTWLPPLIAASVSVAVMLSWRALS